MGSVGYSGLGWVMGTNFHYGMGWIGLDQSFGGLGRVRSKKLDHGPTLHTNDYNDVYNVSMIYT